MIEVPQAKKHLNYTYKVARFEVFASCICCSIYTFMHYPAAVSAYLSHDAHITNLHK